MSVFIFTGTTFRIILLLVHSWGSIRRSIFAFFRLRRHDILRIPFGKFLHGGRICIKGISHLLNLIEKTFGVRNLFLDHFFPLNLGTRPFRFAIVSAIVLSVLSRLLLFSLGCWFATEFHLGVVGLVALPAWDDSGRNRVLQVVSVEGRSVLLVLVLRIVDSQLLAQVREQLIDTFGLLLEDVVEALVHLVAVLLDEALDGLLVQSLVQGGVLRVHVDLAVGELETLDGLLVEDDVEGDLLARLRD